MWDKIKDCSIYLFFPVAVTIIGYYYTTAIKEKEIGVKFIELAVNILAQEPTKESYDIREWATKIIDKYSGVPLSDKAKQDLIKRMSIRSSVKLTEEGRGLLNQEPQIVKSIQNIYGKNPKTLPMSFPRLVFDELKKEGINPEEIANRHGIDAKTLASIIMAKAEEISDKNKYR